MSAAADGPADVRSMAVVHAALRRDFERVGRELTTAPYPAGGRRRALGAHVLWMMDFLHDHHTGEDAGLWPLVRLRNPAAGELLDSLENDHAGIAPLMTQLTAAARSYLDSSGDIERVRLLEALHALEAVLLPHLDREVEEAMPVVSSSITQREWKDWEHRFNVKPKSVRQLGYEGHWLIDGADAESYQVIVGVVAPIPRFVLLHGFRHAYQRRARQRWRAETATPSGAAR